MARLSAKPEVTKQQVNTKFLSTDFERVLAADKGEADTELQEEIADMLDQGALEFTLSGFWGEAQEIEVVGVLDDLLRQLRLGNG